MASLNIEQFGDLVELTLNEYIKTDYVALLTDLTDHPAAKALLNKARFAIKSGIQLEFKLDMGAESSYEHITATTPDSAELTDSFVSASVPWRKVKTSYAYLEEEMDFNMSPNQLVDVVKARERRCDADWIEGIESDWWTFHSVSDTNAFRSLPYWIHKNASTGFNGGIPSGYSDVAGLSPTTYPRWNNYTAQYTTFSLDDAVNKIRTMGMKTGFKPIISNLPKLGMNSRRAFYTNLTVHQTAADLADARNDSMGTDLAKHDGQVTIHRIPLEYVPKLDDDTTDPIYQIDWNSIKMMAKTDWFQRRTVQKPHPGQRNMVSVHKDSYLNFVCFNRRINGVVATGTSYPS